MEHHQIRTNRLTLHVAAAGPETGPLILLLHGFPEFWYGWRRQLPALAAAGFRVWAPDQRGYSRSDKPAGVAKYRIELLADDVLGLMDAAGRQTAFLVGHDWGAAVAWHLAAAHPERIDRMAAINVPHPQVMARHLRRSPRQLLRSWYMLFFQLPWLPEALLRCCSWRLPTAALRNTSLPGTFSTADLKRYREAWSQPGACSAMLNWYRAAFRRASLPSPNPRIRVPTLLIWGAGDRFLGRELAPPSIERCDRGRLEFLEQATHWVHHEQADRVNDLLIRFFQESKSHS